MLAQVILLAQVAVGGAFAFGQRQGAQRPLRDEGLRPLPGGTLARPLSSHDFTPHYSAGMATSLLPAFQADKGHAHLRAFNPSLLLLRDGSILSVFRFGTNGMQVGSQEGKYVESTSFPALHKLGAVRLDAKTLRPLGPSVDALLPLRTAAGGDVRCENRARWSREAYGMIPESAVNHVQDVRLFHWGGAAHMIVSVGNCEHAFGYGSTRLYISKVDPANPGKLGRPHRVVVQGLSFVAFHKNWTPIVSDDGVGLTLELEFEPRQLVVLSNAKAVLRGDSVDAIFEAPRAPVSSAAVLLWQAKWGAFLRGGAPAVRLPPGAPWQGSGGAHTSIGLAHIVTKPLENYQHVFYTFDRRSPHNITGISAPFRLPTLASIVPPELRHELGGRREMPPLIQFATGMVLLGDGKTLLLGFGEKDCAAGFASISLETALGSIERHDDSGTMDSIWQYRCWPSKATDKLQAELMVGGRGIAEWHPLRKKRADEVSGALGDDLWKGGIAVHDRARSWTLPQCASVCHALPQCAGFAVIGGKAVWHSNWAKKWDRDLSCRYLMAPEAGDTDQFPPLSGWEKSMEVCANQRRGVGTASRRRRRADMRNMRRGLREHEHERIGVSKNGSEF